MENDARKTLIGEAIGHALHDTWFGVTPVLLAAISTPLDLSNSDIGLMLLLYQGVSSLTQPIFGRLSERLGGRLFAVGSILWTTLLFTGALFAPTKLILGACITMAGFGSGAFHPQGTTNATVAGGRRYGATAASLFFFGGTLGTAFVGAALGGFLIDQFGRQSLVAISALIIVLALTVVRRMVPRELSLPHARDEAESKTRNGATKGAAWAVIGVLLAAIAFRSLAQHTLVTYTPKFQQDLGVAPAAYGLLLSLFLTANAIGGVLGSFLGDRAGFRQVLVGSLLLSALAMSLFMRLDGLAGNVNFVLTGLFLGPSHTLLLVSGQRRFPQRMAMISGIFLGFTFLSGGGGAWGLGLLSDRIGLEAVLGLLPIAMVGGAVCALIAVPSQRAVAAASQAPEPVANPE